MDLMHRLTLGPLLCDGAMGTQLMAAGLKPGEAAELWNVTRTADVEAIHRAYRDAGCEAITTNTFGGNTISLERHGLADRAAELNELAVRLARRAVGGNCHLLGDIGPTGEFLEPAGTATPQQLTQVFREQAMSLKRGGADAIIIETMSDPAEMRLAIEAAKSVSYWTVIATYAFSAPSADGVFRTMMGTNVDQAIKTAIDAGADIVGANCGSGLTLPQYVQLAKAIVKAAGKTPVIIQPNAGPPQTANGKTVHTATPADMAAIVRPLLDAGVQIIGGCCGTTPEHLKAMAAEMP